MKFRQFVERQVYMHVAEYRSLYVFLAVLFFTGIIFGAVVVNSLSLSQKDDLFIYLQQFFGQVGDGQVTADRDLFWESLMYNVKYIGLMFILGLSVIGSPLILLLLFLKGMAIGFTVGFLVNQMGVPGFSLSLVSVLPQNLIVVPVMIIVAVMSVAFSFRLIRQQFMKVQRQEPIFPHFFRMCLFLLVAVVLLASASAIEAFLSPTLLSWVTENVV
ncbi:stage II sporulation protein M [Geomicrobium sediminis]|uniref:Stage II sporulation protein M n=1 Tax=Geomicrobium sediminis TaxID=1347788 RepID=A0ABS2PE87_9BACL|nr:stage II sporulation protein M [Geomicrobium sediminis]EZH67679.1 stage II sporulation protein M [Bacillaceae bacterium JMAK1]MBM7633602.1 stage II sporulation protein M [Geomicrobium sediminis]